mgnify:FL=1
MIRNEETFRTHPRMGMIYRQLDKLKDRQQIISHAQQLLSQINEL